MARLRIRDLEEASTVQGAKDVMNEGDLPGEGIAWRWLLIAAPLVALVAAAVNTIVYFAATGLGFIDRNLPVTTPGGEHPLTVTSVVVSSAVGAIGAAIVFFLIGLFVRYPVRTFRIVATVVLVLSLAMPLTISGAPAAMILSLMAMHVEAWAVSVGLLTTLARPRAGA